MNETCRELLETYYETNKIPVCIVEQDGEILLSVPKQETEILPEQFRRLCVQDFQLQKRDREHPLVLALEPSYFVGVAQMDPSAYLIFGPVSPVRHTPEEIRKSSIPFVSVEQLSAFGTAVSQTPLMGSRVFVNAFCVACYLAGGVYVPGESVFLCNNTAVMDAVRSGNSKLLRARIFQPYAGRAGKSSRMTHSPGTVCVSVRSDIRYPRGNRWRGAPGGGLLPERQFFSPGGHNGGRMGDLCADVRDASDFLQRSKKTQADCGLFPTCAAMPGLYSHPSPRDHYAGHAGGSYRYVYESDFTEIPSGDRAFRKALYKRAKNQGGKAAFERYGLLLYRYQQLSEFLYTKSFHSGISRDNRDDAPGIPGTELIFCICIPIHNIEFLSLISHNYCLCYNFP